MLLVYYLGTGAVTFIDSELLLITWSTFIYSFVWPSLVANFWLILFEADFFLESIPYESLTLIWDYLEGDNKLGIFSIFSII